MSQTHPQQAQHDDAPQIAQCRAALFDLFDEIGYPGWIGCEYRPKGDTVAGLGWAKKYGIG